MWFRSVDRDNSGSITAHELQMVTFGGFPLGMDIAIKLVKVFDKDRSGTIGESLKHSPAWLPPMAVSCPRQHVSVLSCVALCQTHTLTVVLDFFEYASMHKFITLMQQAFTQGDRVCSVL